MALRIMKKERHIRWNWETVDDKVRYHVIVVDNKNRGKIFNAIFERIKEYQGSIEPVRKCEGKVIDSRFRYLFESFDSNISPNIIDFSSFGNVRRDRDLIERQRGTIEDYVSSIYER